MQVVASAFHAAPLFTKEILPLLELPSCPCPCLPPNTSSPPSSGMQPARVFVTHTRLRHRRRVRCSAPTSRRRTPPSSAATSAGTDRTGDRGGGSDRTGDRSTGGGHGGTGGVLGWRKRLTCRKRAFHDNTSTIESAQRKVVY